MYRAVRAAKPDLPIVMLSLPKIPPRNEALRLERFSVIQDTFRHAKESGDSKVWLLSGADLLGEAAESATVDNCHPNDLGFWFMAKKLAPLLKSILEKEI